MKTEPSKKVTIIHESQEQQSQTLVSRKTLQDLQQTGCDKENLTGRLAHLSGKDGETAPRKKLVAVKKIKQMHKAVQTDAEPSPLITAEDLTSEEPSEDYWKRLAEKRGEALNDSLHENEKLKENMEALQEENKICKNLLDESTNLVEVLQELLQEDELSATED